MKVLPFKIPKPENTALIYQEDVGLVFYDKLHQHDEIQISFIEKGKGTLLIGDSITTFNENDIFVIGSNLPHAFKCDKNNTTNSKMLSLFFTKTSFGSQFFGLNDFDELYNFFTESAQGLRIENAKKELMLLFRKLKNASKINRFIYFFSILNLLNVAQKTTLSSFVYRKKYSDTEGKKMRAIFDYTINNAHNTIYLKDIANVANMTKNAFCKYFKKRTNKTYMNFLTELRIEKACNLLVSNTDLSVNSIAYAVGFNNISNFNRKFKHIKKRTPLQYRNLQIR